MNRQGSSVALRLGIEGDAEIKSTFAAIAESGDASAKRLAASYDRAGEDMTAAMERRAAAIKKLLSIAPPNLSQTIDARMGVGRSATENGASFGALEQQMRRYEAQAEAVRAAIDPVYAAQKRYDGELAIANQLLAVGVLKEEEYARALQMSKDRLDAVNGVVGHGATMSARAQAGFKNLGFQISDVTSQLSTGTSPLIILAQQGGQAASALEDALGSDGIAGKIAGFLTGPWGAALLGATTLIGMWISKSGEAENSGKKLADRQEKLAALFDRTTGAIQRQATALQRLAGADTAQETLRAGRAAQQEQRDGLGDLVRTELARRAGYGGSRGLSEGARGALRAGLATLDAGGGPGSLVMTIRQLAATNPGLARLSESATEMGAAFDTAGQDVEKAQARIAQLNGTATRAQLALLGYTNTIDTSVLDAQAKLRSATSATDKAEAQLTLTRQKADADLRAGTISKEQYTARVAAGEQAVNRARAAEEAHRKGLSESAKAARHEITELDQLARKLGGASEARRQYEKQLADIAADQAKSKPRFSAEDAAAMRAEAMQQFLGKLPVEDLKPAEILTGQAIDTRRSGQTTAASAAQRYVEQLKENWLELQQIGSRTIDTLLDPNAWSDWSAMGKRVIADLQMELWKLAVINPIKNALFGGGAPTLTTALASFGSMFGGAGSPVSSGVLAQNDAWVKGILSAGRNASGTEYWRGGATWVAENGPELITLPRGAKVTPAAQTRRMLAANDGGAVHNHYHFEGAVMTQDLVDQMNAIGDGAAIRGAQGGAQMSSMAQARRRRRALGRSF